MSTTQIGRVVIQTPSLLQLLEPRRLMYAYIDVCLPDGTHTVTDPHVGQVINLQVWAVVNGADSTGSNENFLELFGSFISANIGGGSVRGNLTGSLEPAFDYDNAGTIGTQNDLDGDGDLDLGGANPASPGGYFFANSFNTNVTGTDIGDGSSGAGREMELATLQFTVSSLAAGPQTTIGFTLRPQGVPAQEVSAAWFEDGSVKATSNGDTFGSSIGVDILPEPAALSLCVIAGAVLLQRRRIARNQFSTRLIRALPICS